MKSLLPILVCTLTCIYQFNAQCPISSESVFLHANEIRAAIPSGIELFNANGDLYGRAFYIGNSPSEYRSTFHGGGFLMAGLRQDGSILTAILTNSTAESVDFAAGPLIPLPLPSDYCSNWDKVWSVKRHDIQAHLQDFTDNGKIDRPLNAIMGWPGKDNPHFNQYNLFDLPEGDFAPFFDQNGNGQYDPLQGDYPFVFGPETQPDQITWSVFNDKFANNQLFPVPLNIEIQRTSWAYYCEDNPVLNKTIFTRNKIIYKGTETIDSLFYGSFNDFDIGCYFDDFAGTSIRHNAVFAYNKRPEDLDCTNSLGFGINPPVQSTTFLNKKLFATYINGTGSEGGALPIQTFNVLNGYHHDGLPQTAEGNGYKTNGPVTKFSFPGDPLKDNEWSMFQEKLKDLDVRPMASTYLGTCVPGAVFEIDLAYLFTRVPGKDYLQNVTAMYDQLDSLHVWYQQGFKNTCRQSTLLCNNDCVWPGDADNNGTANHIDLLTIGLHHQATGKVRPGPSTWGPKAADEWSKKDLKHADTDGNGTIEKADFEITMINYNEVRPDYVVPSSMYPVGPELSVYTNTPNTFSNIVPGKNIQANIKLTGIPQLQGLAFSLEYDPRYFFSIDTTIGTNINFQIAMPNNKNHQLDFVRYEIQPGGTLPANDRLYTFIIKANTRFPSGLTSDTTRLRFKNIIGIKSDGTTIPIGGTDLVAVFAKGTVPADPAPALETVEVFPNPASEQLTVQFPGKQLDKVLLYTSTGILVNTQSNCVDQVDIQVRSFAPGIYFLKIEKHGYTSVKKVFIE